MKGGFDFFFICCIICLFMGKLINVVVMSEVNGKLFLMFLLCLINNFFMVIVKLLEVFDN